MRGGEAPGGRRPGRGDHHEGRARAGARPPSPDRDRRLLHGGGGRRGPGVPGDAASLRDAVGMAVEATGVTQSASPRTTATHSQANLEWIGDGLGALASLSGARGRRLTPPGEWDDDAHRALRRGRARIEGVISTLRRAHLLGRAACVGEECVRAPSCSARSSPMTCCSSTKRRSGREGSVARPTRHTPSARRRSAAPEPLRTPEQPPLGRRHRGGMAGCALEAWRTARKEPLWRPGAPSAPTKWGHLTEN